MTISHRAQVQSQLLDPAIPVSTGLRALIVLAEEHGAAATAAWARQELEGHPAGRVPDYRKITAPIYGMAMRHGSPVYQGLALADLPASHRDEVSQRHAALGLYQDVATLEQMLLPAPEYALGPHQMLRPELPNAGELIRLLPPRTDDLRFHTLYWWIKPADVQGVLDKIRTVAEAKAVALSALPPTAPAITDHQAVTVNVEGKRNNVNVTANRSHHGNAGFQPASDDSKWGRRQTIWTIISVVVAIVGAYFAYRQWKG